MSDNEFDPYDHLPSELKILDEKALRRIEEICPGLSELEVMDYFAISPAQLKENQLDNEYFHAAFRRGKSIAKIEATRLLFTAMKGRNAVIASSLYLKTFGERWEINKAGEASVDSTSPLSLEEMRDECSRRGLVPTLIDMD